jgi:hypothetical protein
MTEVRYYCPRCEAIAALEREGYLADKCVTPYPLDGWEYAATYENFEDSAERSRGKSEISRPSGDDVSRDSADHSSGRSPREDADGVEIVCGAKETDGEGCGEVYYLSFVKFEDGEEVEPRHLGDVLPNRSTVAQSGRDADEDDDDGPRFDFKP